MIRRTPVRTALAILAAGVVLGSVAAACGDGRPAFCDDLARDGDLGGLTGALSAGRLAGAKEEAGRLTDLAEAAPADIREQFGALADAVADIVDLLEAEAAGGPPGTTPPTRTPRRPGARPPRRRPRSPAAPGSTRRRWSVDVRSSTNGSAN